MESRMRRRESFVDPRRKSLTLTGLFTEENEGPDSKKQRLSIKQYGESLLKEKDEWKEIFKQKKKKCEEAESKLKFQPYTIDRNTVENKFTTEDKSFLDDKPDYMEMMKTVQRYYNCIRFITKYKSDIINYYNKACDQIELNNKCLIDEMTSNDLCDVCNTKDCIHPSHKFNVNL